MAYSDACPTGEQQQPCPICGGLMFGAHCKLICRNCGYREDCSDLFPVQPQPPDGQEPIEGSDPAR